MSLSSSTTSQRDPESRSLYAVNLLYSPTLVKKAYGAVIAGSATLELWLTEAGVVKE